MARIYSVPFVNVSVAAVQDLFSLQTTSGMAVELHEITIGQVTSTTVASARLSWKRFSGAYTIGSGGNSATPAKLNFGDAAAVATGRINDTTQTSAGTSVVFHGDVFNYVNGFLWLPAPEDRPIIAPSQAFVLSLDNVPSTATMSGTLTFAELF